MNCSCRWIFLATTLVSLRWGVSGGAFQNLNFELTRFTIPPTAVGEFGPIDVDPALAFPGWTIGTSGTVTANRTLYNNLTVGSVAQVLVGPNFPNAIGYSALEGNYSALLQFGPSLAMGTPALSQVGLVPVDARSITFLMSATQNDALVTLDGVVIPLVSLGDGRVAGDVTQFAGFEVELKFSTTRANGPWLYFDDVKFSSAAVPEPSVLGLGAAGFGFFLWSRNRRNGPRRLE